MIPSPSKPAQLSLWLAEGSIVGRHLRPSSSSGRFRESSPEWVKPRSREDEGRRDPAGLESARKRAFPTSQ